MFDSHEKNATHGASNFLRTISKPGSKIKLEHFYDNDVISICTLHFTSESHTPTLHSTFFVIWNIGPLKFASNGKPIVNMTTPLIILPSKVRNQRFIG